MRSSSEGLPGGASTSGRSPPGSRASVVQNQDLVRFTAPEGEIVVFEDGRALLKGVSDVPQARSLFSKYVGN
jgi:hypothetical protein